MVRTSFRSSSGLPSPNKLSPKYNNNNPITNCKIASPIIILHILKLIKASIFEWGRRLSRFSEGGSVASASAAMVSIIIFTHNNCTAVKALSPLSSKTAEIKDRLTAVILTVN
eukprot:Lithocolla_globosa_v1_NODE_856_length_3177_cov_20.386611.p3 type:complete len:113 gc:universal NODE_856_length_3177_cov_20.386611:493-831(+)